MGLEQLLGVGIQEFGEKKEDDCWGERVLSGRLKDVINEWRSAIAQLAEHGTVEMWRSRGQWFESASPNSFLFASFLFPLLLPSNQLFLPSPSLPKQKRNQSHHHGVTPLPDDCPPFGLREESESNKISPIRVIPSFRWKHPSQCTSRKKNPWISPKHSRPLLLHSPERMSRESSSSAS